MGQPSLVADIAEQTADDKQLEQQAHAVLHPFAESSPAYAARLSALAAAGTPVVLRVVFSSEISLLLLATPLSRALPASSRL